MVICILCSSYHQDVNQDLVELCYYTISSDGTEYTAIQHYELCPKSLVHIFMEPSYPARVLKLSEYDWKKRRS